MTTAQTRAYWRAWSMVVRVNRWSMVCGALHPQAALDVSDIHRAVWEAAEARAKRAGCAVTADDLRHGCHLVALGRDKSMKDLGNGRDATRVFAVMRLLANPDEVAARITYLDREGEADSRRRMVHRIRTAAPLAYVLNISRDRFGTEDWESLPLANLRQLVMIISQRTQAFRKPVMERKEMEAAPF